MLHIYNSLTQKKEPLVPIHPDKIGLYVCGITAYDYCHIGHGRVMVTFDTVVRYLRYRGYDVTYVRNITDIDDKIIKRAQENNESIEALTARFIEAMHEDTAALNCLSPDVEPRATEHLPTIIAMIEKLLKNDYAYLAANGDVYFRVKKFNNYGQLSHKSIEGLKAGARIEITEAKEDPLDFALWKKAKSDEPQWDSPWGAGRPGWHIECSAMSTHCLGNHFDLHGGGFDLIFPHHENEIAQAEGANTEKFVTSWMHVGFVQINKEKMSKSLNNFFTIREILARYPAEVLRYFLIASHYRSPINYSLDSIEQAYSALARLYNCLRNLPAANPAQQNEYEEKFLQKMDDDFNTPEALAVLFELVNKINRLKNSNLNEAASLGAQLRQLANLLGLLKLSPEAFLHGNLTAAEKTHVEDLVNQRMQARADKDWQAADELRNNLSSLGIVIEDTATETIWRKIPK